MPIWTVLRPLLVAAAVPAAVFAVDRVLQLAVGRLSAARPGARRWHVLRRCRIPVLATATAALLLGCEPAAGLGPGIRPPVRHALLLAVLVSAGWLTARTVSLFIESALTTYAAGRRDPGRVRRVRTQVDLVGRISDVAIAVLTLAAALMTFPAVRAVGASLLASAGLLGLVAGVAAQSSLANLFAGIQLAFGDMVRIGDVVVVAGEWGTVEEITLTAVVIATWDQRRIVMPVSYFAGKPFENWSRRDPGITGTVLLHLDHRTPVEELRAEFEKLLAGDERWDGTGRALQVVDTTPSTIVVRALMTAADADRAFELRCAVREHLVAFLRDRHPYALPRVTVARTEAVAGSFPDGTAPFPPDAVPARGHAEVPTQRPNPSEPAGGDQDRNRDQERERERPGRS
ncbi:mechanosensitive ion channel family protein [Kitasatospora sp. NPDC058406]|uniref:mechanosensitive ion channel family protein n=1 Tax=Kitasatospora sp. NPDC058406 TaxID=3346483 RepID=UPI00364E4A73